MDGINILWSEKLL
uniref:Uncharacterized protein n=1 Tax=Rhizophora mucronata TaxID=61149 RepID=A0A2P2IV12_RHIMU